jgi:hypothetical protein
MEPCYYPGSVEEYFRALYSDYMKYNITGRTFDYTDCNNTLDWNADAALHSCSETVLVDGDLHSVGLLRNVFHNNLPDVILKYILGYLYAYDEKRLERFQYLMWYRDWHVPFIFIKYLLEYSISGREFRYRKLVYEAILNNLIPFYYQFKHSRKKYKIRYSDTTSLLYLDENFLTILGYWEIVPQQLREIYSVRQSWDDWITLFQPFW